MNTQDLFKRLDSIELQSRNALSTHTKDTYDHYVKYELVKGFRSSGLSFLSATFGESHPFYKEFDRVTERSGYHELLGGIEILKSVRIEIENGWFKTYKGIVSAEIFSDFLEMAEHLLENKYKDPAAVMIGSVLEEHLRQLCIKNQIDISHEKEGKLIPNKADRLNADLTSKGIYNKLDNKSVTSWLELRNKAAHGQYDGYGIEQVQIMYSGVLDFMTRNIL